MMSFSVSRLFSSRPKNINLNQERQGDKQKKFKISSLFSCLSGSPVNQVSPSNIHIPQHLSEFNKMNSNQQLNCVRESIQSRLEKDSDPTVRLRLKRRLENMTALEQFVNNPTHQLVTIILTDGWYNSDPRMHKGKSEFDTFMIQTKDKSMIWKLDSSIGFNGIANKVKGTFSDGTLLNDIKGHGLTIDGNLAQYRDLQVKNIQLSKEGLDCAMVAFRDYSQDINFQYLKNMQSFFDPIVDQALAEHKQLDPNCFTMVPQNRNLLSSSEIQTLQKRNKQLDDQKTIQQRFVIPGQSSPVVLRCQNTQYSINETLGVGQFGRVFKATDQKNQTVVVKAMRIPPYEDKKKFQDEFDLQNKLNHQNIAKVNQLDFTQPITNTDNTNTNEMAFLSMDYIQGKPLQNCFDEHIDLANLIQKIKDAFEYMHRQNIFHRDIKLENIMIQKDGDPILIDFGEAIELTQDNQSLNYQTGSPEYMHPGLNGLDNHKKRCIAKNRGILKKADYYSLAVCMYDFQSKTVGAFKEMLDSTVPNLRNNPYDPISIPWQTVQEKFVEICGSYIWEFIKDENPFSNLV